MNDTPDKPVRGENEGITVLPLLHQQQGTGRSGKFIKDRDQVCLTPDQTKYIYNER